MSRTSGIVCGAAGFLAAFMTAGYVPAAGDGGGDVNWPCWRGPDRNGISRETGWFKPDAVPKAAWKVSVGKGYSNVAISEGKLYTMGNMDGKDVVVCLDVKTGNEIWKHSYDCPPGDYPGPRATPVVDGKDVYTLSRNAQMFCLDKVQGKVKWSREFKKEMKVSAPGWGFAGSPLVLDPLVVLNCGSRGLAVDKRTGETAWSSGTDAGGYGTPVVFDHKGKPAVALFALKSVVGVSVADGKRLWEYPWETKYDVNAADPVVDGDKVFISSGYERGCALLKLAGEKADLVWENKNLSSHFSSPVLWKGFLYGISGNTGHGDLRCVDIATGSVKWSQKMGFGSLMLADGKLIILTERGELVISEASSSAYQELLRTQVIGGVCWSMPVLCGGRIYCRNEKGDLIALEI